jgi:hypothetical protein
VRDYAQIAACWFGRQADMRPVNWDAVLDSVRWLVDHGQLDVASPLKV